MGKDRAGVAAALLLYALGASMKDIMADYMYTGICCAEKKFGAIPMHVAL